MSILLDALKKSEEQRQLGKVPGIHSASGGGPAQPSRTRYWSLLLIIVGAVAVAWFGWRQLQSPASSGLPADETVSVAAEDAVAEPAAVASDSAPPTQPTDESSVAGQAAPRRTPVETLPVESGREPAAMVAASDQEPEPRKSRVNESFTAFEAGRQAAAEPREQPASAAAPASPTPAAAEQVAEAAIASETQSASAKERARAEPRTTQPISYWELPQGIRDDLPELRITVLVYAESPKDRFVLVGGQRLVEKDEYQDGVVLEEIRREGAVFLYRNYRFLVEG